MGVVPTRGVTEKGLEKGFSPRVKMASRGSGARYHGRATIDKDDAKEKKETMGPFAMSYPTSSLPPRPDVLSPPSSTTLPCSLPIITSEVKNRVVTQLAKKLHVVVNRRLQERQGVEEEEKKTVVWVPKPTSAAGGTLAGCVDEETGRRKTPHSPLSQGRHPPMEEAGVRQVPLPSSASSPSVSSASVCAVTNRGKPAAVSPHERNEKQSALHALPLKQLMKEAFPEWKDTSLGRIASTELVPPPPFTGTTTTETHERDEANKGERTSIMKFFSAGSIPFPSDKKYLDVKAEDGMDGVQPSLSFLESSLPLPPALLSLAPLSLPDALPTTTTIVSRTCAAPTVLEEKTYRRRIATTSGRPEEEKDRHTAQQVGGDLCVDTSAHLLASGVVAAHTSTTPGIDKEVESEETRVHDYLMWLTHRFRSETVEPLAWPYRTSFSAGVEGIEDRKEEGSVREGSGHLTAPPALSPGENSLCSPMVVHSIQLNAERQAKEENDRVSGAAVTGRGTTSSDAFHNPAAIISKMLRDAKEELQEQEKERVGLVRIQRLRANPNFNRGIFAGLPVYQGRSGHWFGYTIDKLDGERQRVLTACRRAILDGPIQNWLGSFFETSFGKRGPSLSRMESKENSPSAPTGEDGEGSGSGSRHGGRGEHMERRTERTQRGAERKKWGEEEWTDDMLSASPVSDFLAEEKEEGVARTSRERRWIYAKSGAPFAVFRLSTRNPTDVFSKSVKARWGEEDVMFSRRASMNAQNSRFRLSHSPYDEDRDGKKFHLLIHSLSEIIDAAYGKNLTVEEKEEAKKRLRQARERMRLKATLDAGRARGKIGKMRLAGGGGGGVASASQSKKKLSTDDALQRSKVGKTGIEGEVSGVLADALEKHPWMLNDRDSRYPSPSPISGKGIATDEDSAVGRGRSAFSSFSPGKHVTLSTGLPSTRTQRVTELISPSSDSGGEDGDGESGVRSGHGPAHRHRTRGKGSPLTTSSTVFAGKSSLLRSSSGSVFSARRTTREHRSRDGREGSNALFASVKDEEIPLSFSMSSFREHDPRHPGEGVEDGRREKRGTTVMRESRGGREGRRDDDTHANLILPRFSEAKKSEGLRREANAILTHLDHLGFSSLTLSPQASKSSFGHSFSSIRGRKEMHGSKDDNELSSLALSLGSIPPPEGFSVDESALIARFKKEVEKENEEMMKGLRRLRKEVEKQRKALHNFQYDIQFLSGGTNEMTADEYAAELLRDVNEYAKAYHLSVYELMADGDGQEPESPMGQETHELVMQTSDEENSSGGGKEKDPSRLTTIHQNFLDHFRGNKNTQEKKSVACQVTEEDLGVVEGSIQLATEQLEDLMFHERSLMDGIRLATVAVANVMSFHASLELESTCKQCFFLLDRPRTLWPCGHTFCHQCLVEMCNDHEEVTCAECGSICEVGYTPNYAIEQVAHYQVVQEAVEDQKLRGKKTTIEGVLRNLLMDLLNTQKNISLTPKREQEDDKIIAEEGEIVRKDEPA